jgi:hypothetical protein
MRLFWSLSVIAVASSVSAFAPSNVNSRQTALHSTVAPVAASEIKAKQEATLSKLAARDQQSSAISKDVS